MADSRRTLPSPSTGIQYQVTAGVAALRNAPASDAEMVSVALHGETVTLAREDGGFGLIQMQSDHYIGWVDMDALSAPALPITHRVCALRTYVFSDSDLKSAPRFLISLNAGVIVEKTEGKFSYCARAGWVTSDHLVPVGTVEADPAAVAERFVGTPYLWGGKESLGLDCTGLTQMAFAACGVDLPRDSDMQWADTGEHIPDWTEPGALRRNDLVFWKGHVGIMADSDTLIHSNAFHMAVAKEKLSDAIQRIAACYGQPIGAKRVEF